MKKLALVLICCTLWLSSSIFGLGMVNYYLIEKYHYHDNLTYEKINLFVYRNLLGVVAIIPGPIILIVSIIEVSRRENLPHSKWGLAYTKNMTWPKYH
ncbi:MAG: hypothetical protein HYW77_01850 [Parcubacteria group bacterium]|nr:hypothetical protein [Parcubacteria group bacterium]